MKLRELLIDFIPSKEIKTRLANGQIKVNNEIVKENIELDVQEGYWFLGDFIYFNCRFILNSKIIGDVKNFFGPENTNIKTHEFLTGFTLISFSKKDHLVFITK